MRWLLLSSSSRRLSQAFRYSLWSFLELTQVALGFVRLGSCDVFAKFERELNGQVDKEDVSPEMAHEAPGKRGPWENCH